jgi:hypothetical protein
MVVANLRERLAVSKQDAQKFDGEKFNLRMLNEPEVKNKYQIEITNRFAALENLNTDEHVNGAWETIKENIKSSAKDSLSLHELKQHKQWFDQECLRFLDQRKQTKCKWIQDPSRNNVDTLNNARRDASRNFKNKNKAYLISKTEDHEANSKIKKTLVSCIGASVTLRRVTNLELIYGGRQR